MINKDKYYIDPDISKAHTLPASFYRDPIVFEKINQKFLKIMAMSGRHRNGSEKIVFIH